MHYKKHKIIANRKIFYWLAKAVKYSIFAQRKAVEEKILLSGSIKNFFSYSKSPLHPFVNTRPIKDNTNNLIECDLGKAELFSEFFYFYSLQMSNVLSWKEKAPPLVALMTFLLFFLKYF